MNSLTKQILKIFVYIIPIIILLIFLVLAYYLQSSFSTISEEKFSQDSLDYKKSVEKKLNEYIHLIQDAQSTFSAIPEVNRKTFQDYFELINVQQSFPAISSFVYLTLIDINQIDEFQNEIDEDDSWIYPYADDSFTIKPINNSYELGDKDGHLYVSTYVFPYTERTSSLGVDLSAELLRKEAIDRAIVLKEPIASQTITFTNDNLQGFHLLVPLFDPSSKDVFALLSASFKLNDFLVSLNEDLPNQSELYLEISDSNGKTLLSNLPNSLEQDDLLKDSFLISLGRKEWKLDIYTNKNYYLTETLISAPLVVSATGLGLALLVGIIIYLLSQSSFRTAVLANSLTKDLRITQKRYKDILNNSSALIYLKDLNGNYLFANKSFKDTLKLKYSDLTGRRTVDLFNEGIAKQILNNEQKVIQTISELKVEESLPTKTLGTVTYASTKFPLLDQDGVLYGIASISTNIEDQKKYEEELTKRNTELEKLNRLMLNREIKMAELKKEIEKLSGEKKTIVKKNTKTPVKPTSSLNTRL